MPNDDEIIEILATPITTQETKALVVPAATKVSVEEDAEYARRNIRAVIDNGSQALQTAILVAEGSQHPRALEVVGQLMKTMSEINKDLLSIHEQERKLSVDSPSTSSPTVHVEKAAVFVGTTAELMAQARNGKLPQ